MRVFTATFSYFIDKEFSKADIRLMKMASYSQRKLRDEFKREVVQHPTVITPAACGRRPQRVSPVTLLGWLCCLKRPNIIEDEDPSTGSSKFSASRHRSGGKRLSTNKEKHSSPNLWVFVIVFLLSVFTTGPQNQTQVTSTLLCVRSWFVLMCIPDLSLATDNARQDFILSTLRPTFWSLTG